MPLTITQTGERNVIEISEAMLRQGQGRIFIEGSDNLIRIEESSFNIGLNVTLGNQCSLRIGRNVNCLNLSVYQGRDAHLTIGETVSFNGCVRLLMHEAGALSIGSGCLIADQVDISISDMHSIVDVKTQARLNPARDIKLGERVWVGQRAMIFKGSEIGHGSVIGAGTIVTGPIPGNCVAAGNPARIIRRDASWNFNLL
jgi:acetyltransferase-like isoleucine patch superfamily enzyme